jgi:hypothetical protein
MFVNISVWVMFGTAFRQAARVALAIFYAAVFTIEDDHRLFAVFLDFGSAAVCHVTVKQKVDPWMLLSHGGSVFTFAVAFTFAAPLLFLLLAKFLPLTFRHFTHVHRALGTIQ